MRIGTRKARATALVLAGLVIGMLLISPVSAHFTTSSTHLSKHAWKFIKGKGDARWINNTEKAADSDLLDGMDSAAFAALAHTHDAADIVAGTLADARIPATIARDAEVFGIVLGSDGPGSGLDADLLDGISSVNVIPGGTAPSGTTVRGTYLMGGTAAGASALAVSEISFGYQFSAAPTSHFIASGDPVPMGCSGTPTSPGAAPGHLCVFEALASNAGVRNTNGPGGDGTTYAFGARLFIRSAGAGDFFSGGTWAATAAGAGPSPSSPGTGTVLGGRVK